MSYAPRQQFHVTSRIRISLLLSNEMLISCKRRVKTYSPYRLKEDWTRTEFRAIRVCRLH
jgi:hypothetical protein